MDPNDPRRRPRARLNNGFLLDPDQSVRRRLGRVAAPFRRPSKRGDVERDAAVAATITTARDEHRAATPDSEAGSAVTTTGSASSNRQFDGSHASSSSHGDATLDPSSAELIKLALNLGESRRLAQRMPLRPDAGSALRQHIQQQRRTSLAPALPPTLRPLSPRANLDVPGAAAGFYPSASTLARVQKAKDHITLQTLYWHLLEALPPLQRDGGSGGRVFGQHEALGRQYNPLQFIRNRKVRARERRAIDGEAQGFGDAEAVAGWVQQVWEATPGVSDALPPFAGDRSLTSPTPAPKRPRADWTFAPADLLADAYWLAQGRNKLLIEDRHLNKIFEAPAESHASPRLSFTGSHAHSLSHSHDDNDFHLDKADTDHSHNSARDRARQKLHEIKDGFHHRHHHPHLHENFLRGLGGHASESSDDESRRQRANTLTRSSQEVLRRQMEDEERDERLDTSTPPPPPRRPVQDERPMLDIYEEDEPRDLLRRIGRRSRANSRLRKGSFTSIDSDDKRTTARASLEVPRFDDSAPTTPDLRPTRMLADLSSPPVSRPVSPISPRPPSPTRNPLAKVKNMFRDRDDEQEAAAAIEKAPSMERTSSPTRKPSSRSTGLRQDQAASKNIFKGARIDTVLRGAGSRLSEFLWRKDAGVADVVVAESDNEDDGDRPQAAATQSPSSPPHRQRPALEIDVRPHHLGVPPALSRPGSAYSRSRPSSSHQSPRDGGTFLAPPYPPPRDWDSDESRWTSRVPSPATPDRRLSTSLVWLSRTLDAARRASLVQHRQSTLQDTSATRREVARLRAQIVSAGVLAMQIAERERATTAPAIHVSQSRDVARQISLAEQQWAMSRDTFLSTTAPALHARIEATRALVAEDLSRAAHSAADDADELAREIATSHRLAVTRTVDGVEKLLRRRRRRLRWARRAVWQGVEWALVGFMWWVWFIVMAVRIVVGVYTGVRRGVRWLLWL